MLSSCCRESKVCWLAEQKRQHCYSREEEAMLGAAIKCNNHMATCQLVNSSTLQMQHMTLFAIRKPTLTWSILNHSVHSNPLGNFLHEQSWGVQRDHDLGFTGVVIQGDLPQDKALGAGSLRQSSMQCQQNSSSTQDWVLFLSGRPPCDASKTQVYSGLWGSHLESSLTSLLLVYTAPQKLVLKVKVEHAGENSLTFCSLMLWQ